MGQVEVPCRQTHMRIVFDMASTVLSPRFFSLPGVSLVCLNELANLRGPTCRKKEIISTIRFGKGELERDRVKKTEFVPISDC